MPLSAVLVKVCVHAACQEKNFLLYQRLLLRIRHMNRLRLETEKHGERLRKLAIGVSNFQISDIESLVKNAEIKEMADK